MNKILSFDQASITTGYAYFENNQLKAVSHFTCRANDFGERLEEFRNHVIKLLDQYQPDEVIFEDIQLQERVNGVKNTDSVVTFKKLAEIFGILYELLTERDIPCQAVIPNVWKASFKIAGKGRPAEKKAAQKWVANSYGINCTEDEADAVCIGSHLIKKRAETFDWS